MDVVLLYVEELKAAMRGRFAWVGAGVVLLGVGVLATVGTQDTWLDGYGIVAYGLLPLGFIPIAACLVAAPRASRFVECVFTAPVSRRDWLAAKIGVVLTLAAGYYVALVPMLIVYAHHVGVPPLLHKFLVWTPELLVVSVAVGVLIGVLFIGTNIAAPAGASVGVLLLYAGLMPLQELLVAQNNGATRTGHVALLSPAVLLKNALGFTLAASSIPASTARTWASLAFIVVVSIGLALWVFLRAQGVETWEATPVQRWLIAMGIASLAIVPVVTADTNYDAPAPRQTRAPAIRGLFARAGGDLALVDPGGSVPSRCCGTILNRDRWPPFGTDRETGQDLLVLLPVDAEARMTSLQIQIAGDDGLRIDTNLAANADPLSRLETHEYRGEGGPMAPDGRRLANGWIARVPVILDPTDPWDIGGDRYPLTVTTTYHVAGEPATRTITSRAAIDAQVASGIYEMAAVSSVLPLLCFVAAFRRWRRTR